MDTAQAEDLIIDAIRALGLLRSVQSAGRDGQFRPDAYPAASVVFLSDTAAAVSPRAIWEPTFAVLVKDKNLRGEKEAARGVYGTLDAVRDALHGKDLGVAGIEPFYCRSRRLLDYDKGEIEYQLTFTCRVIGAVVAP